ncbi:30S ribosomal protein S4 [Patescibacteria group bacterium]
MLNNARCKKCRREGKKLFLKGDRCNGNSCAILKRNYPPGIHGNKKYKKLTEYGMQLREKQQAKSIYGINEKQFENYFNNAIKKKGDTGNQILGLLERRLDNVIYRIGLAKSRSSARQFVGHNFFMLNDKKASIPSMQVKVNDIIKLKKINKKNINELVKKIDLSKLPSWASFDIQTSKIKITGDPTVGEVSPQFDLKAIVEYYSR